MTHTLIVTAVVLMVYGAAATTVLTIYRAADVKAPRLARMESDAARRLVAGSLDQVGYRRTMAVLAALDDVAHPLTVPGPPRQDDGPATR
ncbi:hypothetical protein [Dactylosporangium sp. NPDC050588]|uniref:hypothetical protein n=1 Tax=Dactylosporangium sp. NPDC050588 TaxID=3157211 RepID=UPI0033F561C2